MAEAAVAAGMAVRVLPEKLGAGCLGQALDRVLSDRALGASAAELRRAATCYDGPSVAADVLESLTLRFSRLEARWDGGTGSQVWS